MFTMMVIMALFTTELAGPLLPRGQAAEAFRPEPRLVASGSQTTRPADRTLGRGEPR
jgi:hypothetical protein